MNAKDILKLNAPLTPSQQRSLVRSSTVIVNRIDRVKKCVRDGIYEGELADKLPEVLRDIEEMIKQRDIQIAYLKKWGTRTR
jgi:hypothetical protein